MALMKRDDILSPINDREDLIQVKRWQAELEGVLLDPPEMDDASVMRCACE